MLQALVSTFTVFDALAWHAPLTLVSIGVLLFAWRLWVFSIKPALHPERPREVPYWIPWLGHAPAFVSDGQSLIRRGRLYFKNTREPFFLTLGGQRLFVFTSPDDVALVYRDTQAFTFDKAVAELTHQFGVSKESCVAFYESPKTKTDDPATKAGFENPSLKSIAHLNNDYLKLQLHPGRQFDDVAAKFARILHERISEKHLTESIVIERTSDRKVISFLKWSQDVLLQTASRAMFGAELLEQSPSLFEDFLAFDDENWRLWYKMPGSDHVRRAKDKCVDAFERYIDLPRQDRPSMAPVIDYYERILRAKGIRDREIATVLTMLYFVTNTNTWKLAFWIMAYLLFNPTAMEQVQLEVKAAFDPTTRHVDFKYLLDECRFFNAVFDETLRLCSANASIRTTVKQVKVGGKIIPADSQVLCPFRELHWNKDVWGQDPSIWNPTRFYKNRSLNRNANYRPFGGGLSYCPGRFIARAEALLFVALILERFEVELKPGQEFPRYDTKPNPALMTPVAGDDLLLLVRAR